MSKQRKSSPSRDLPVDETYTGEEYELDFDNGASLITLASTVNSYRFENGRRYHAYRDGSYWGPNDERDSHHQIITHHLYCLLLNDRLFLAPLSNPRRALDVGTGRGLWALDFADQFPDTQVIGTDLSPEWERLVPPNLRFEVDDCCSSWTYPPNSFDFIHIRGLFGSVADWPKFYKECYDHLVPGGYIEQGEAGVEPRCDDGTLKPDSILYRWHDFAVSMESTLKKPLNVTETMKESIIEAGFVDVVETRFKMPLGPWTSDPRMKELGRWYRNYWETGMEGWSMAPGTRHLGWKSEEVHAFVSETRKALSVEKAHVYYEWAIVYGRKPPERDSTDLRETPG